MFAVQNQDQEDLQPVAITYCPSFEVFMHDDDVGMLKSCSNSIRRNKSAKEKMHLHLGSPRPK